MDERDIKGLLWLLKRINKDKIISNYFRVGLNSRDTDIAKIIIPLENIVKQLDNPMVYLHDEISVPIIPQIRIEKI